MWKLMFQTLPSPRSIGWNLKSTQCASMNTRFTYCTSEMLKGCSDSGPVCKVQS